METTILTPGQTIGNYRNDIIQDAHHSSYVQEWNALGHKFNHQDDMLKYLYEKMDIVADIENTDEATVPHIAVFTRYADRENLSKGTAIMQKFVSNTLRETERWGETYYLSSLPCADRWNGWASFWEQNYPGMIEELTQSNVKYTRSERTINILG